MKRVCCFCESWESGGIESFLNNILQRMDLSDYQVDIVAAHIGESVFTDSLACKGVRLVVLSGKLRSPQNARLFRELLRKQKYDVIHFNLFQGLALYYVQIAKEEGVSVRIVHSHGAGLRNSRTKWLKLILHRAGKKLWWDAATDFWACSRAAADFLFPRSVLERSDFCVIPNGIATERFRFNRVRRDEIRAELGLSDQFVIGNVGRLSSEKNQSFLMAAAARVFEVDPAGRLLLVGTGPQEQMLQEKAARLGIEDRVLFRGTSEQVERLLWAMDVFAFPSLFEGLGLAMVEAQAAGLPVVCSEGIPAETHLTPFVKTVMLNSGAQAWADALLSCNLDIPREDMAEMVRKAGFDVSECAQSIQRKYLET